MDNLYQLMPINPESIQDPASTIPANSEEAPETSGLPEEILAMPIFKGILEGSPAALWTPTGDKSPEAVTAVKNGKALNEAGIFFFRDKSSGLDLIYNARFIDPALVEAAAKKGKLKEVAQPLAETVASFNGAAGLPPAAGGSVEPSAGGAVGPVGASEPSTLAETPVNTARLNNLQPGSPTSGPQPGSGRVLNGLMRPTI